jgi:hypothetical protein
MNFGQAIDALKESKAVRRKRWNGGKNIIIKLFFPDKGDLMPAHIYHDNIKHTDSVIPRNRTPWVPSQSDMLADDWEISE